MKVAKAYSPAGLSGLFSAHTEPSDIYRKGARGAGIALAQGVNVTVEAEESERAELLCYLNGRRAELGLVNRLLDRIAKRAGIRSPYRIVVKQEVDVPVGGGLGTSGASALATALALGKVLNAGLSYIELAREAHAAEIEEGTGLGTISGLAIGGAVAVVRPGAPGYDSVLRLVADPDLRVIVGFFGPISKREALARLDIARINELGRRALAELLREPTIERFVECSKRFALQAGFMTERVRGAITAAEESGAIGASQAMIGETVFAIAAEEQAESVAKAMEKLGAQTLVTEISWSPARLIP